MIPNHIDVSSVLRRTVCDLYSNLVTRQTGAAVRTGIEQQLGELRGRTLTVIDFTHVGLLDFSCADEVVAKLLLRYCGGAHENDAYFLFRGMSEDHLHAIETALGRYGLALVVERKPGDADVVGAVDDGERRAWRALYRAGRTANPADVARAVGSTTDDAERLLETLLERRLVLRLDDGYAAVGQVR